MIELVIVSRLLEYPDAALWQHQQEMFEAIAASKNLSKEDAHALGIFLRDLTAMDPLDAQAQYSELFDRGRATSLLLFEHVHGESRDRGQAMVDLLAQYEQHGLQLNSRELPDHLPLYLADRLDECRGLDFLTLYFTDESSAQVADILKEYQQKGRRDGITRGLYYRHVK